MIEFELNPPSIDDEMLEGLNYSYKGWGERRYYHWVFHCEVDGMKPDIIIGRKDGMIVYGAAIFYRSVFLWNGNKIKVGIIGSGFTIPGYRGKGYSSEGIRRGIELAGSKDAALMTGFVIFNNPSYRNMIVNNGEFFPTNYFRIDKGMIGTIEGDKRIIVVEDSAISRIVHQKYIERNKLTRFDYSFDQFKHQFIERPSDIRVLSFDEGSGYIILERKDGQDKVLFMHLDSQKDFRECIQELIRFSFEDGMGLFHFTTLPDEAEICRKLGFNEISGVLPTFISNLDSLRKGVVSDGPMNGSIYNKDNPWFIGEWDIKNGDRM